MHFTLKPKVMNIRTFLIFFLTLEVTFARQFDECEFAVELYTRHEIEEDEMYKHLCVADVELETNSTKVRGDSSFFGLYQIGSDWWCKKEKAGGACKIKCSSLANEDISDDVACAKIIIRDQGLSSWGKNDQNCKSDYEQRSANCLHLIEKRVDIAKWIFSVLLIQVAVVIASTIIIVSCTERK